MAARRDAETTEVEAFPTAEATERPRGKGNYKDGEAVEAEVVGAKVRPYSEAVTDEHREAMAKYGLAPRS